MPASTYRRKSLRRPNRKVYGMSCLFIFVMATYRAVKVAKNPSWKPRFEHDSPITLEIEGAKTRLIGRFMRDLAAPILKESSFSETTVRIASFMTEDTISVWCIVNLMFCFFIMGQMALLKYAFGPVYPTERRPIFRKLYNYGYNKFLFVFAISQCQYVDEVLFWCYWLATVGVLRAVILLCKYRQLLYSVRAMSAASVARRRLWLVLGVVGVILIMMGSIAYTFGHQTIYMIMPVLVIGAALCQRVVCNYMQIEYTMEKRTEDHYYVTLAFDVTRLAMEGAALLHQAAAALHRPTAMAVVLMQMHRLAMRRALGRYGQHVHYMALRGYVRIEDEALKAATVEELAAHGDVCAVCWFAMETAAVKLHCGHMYHRSCLRKWLLQDRTCPLCRAALPPPRGRTMSPDTAQYAEYLIETMPSLAWVSAARRCLRVCMQKYMQLNMRNADNSAAGQPTNQAT